MPHQPRVRPTLLRLSDSIDRGGGRKGRTLARIQAITAEYELVFSQSYIRTVYEVVSQSKVQARTQPIRAKCGLGFHQSGQSTGLRSGNQSKVQARRQPIRAMSRLEVSNLCDPMDCSPPGSSVQEILQARILE